jgi:predicted negative regulator of RcsB-dependent stress response
MKEKLTQLTQWFKENGIELFCVIGLLIAFFQIYLLLLKMTE